MNRVLVVLRDAVSQTNRYLGLMVLSNIGAALASLPIVIAGLLVLEFLHAGFAAAVALVAIVGVFPSPTTAGVQFVAHETAHRNPVFWRDQVDGIREYGWFALRCWAVSTFVGIVLGANCVFYYTHHVPLSGLIATGWLVALVWWTLCHLYVYPLIMEQEQQRLFLVYRNAMLIALARPGFTIILGLLWLIVLYALSLTALVGIFGLILCAQIQQNAGAVIFPTFDRDPVE